MQQYLKFHYCLKTGINFVSYLSPSVWLQLSKRLLNNSIFSNTTASLLVKGSTIISRLIVLVIVARLLSPSTYGTVTYILSIVEIMRQVADFGMDTYAIRQLNILRLPIEKQAFLNGFAFSRLILSIGTYLLLISFIFTEYVEDITTTAILGLLIISGLWTNYAMNYFQSQLRMMSVVGIVLGANIASVFVLFLVINTVEIPTSILLVMLPLSEMVIAVILLYRMYVEMPFKFWSSEAISLRTLIHASFPIAITSIIAMFYSRLDILLLNLLSTPSEVGYYSVASRLLDPFLYIALYLSISFYSVISSAICRDISYAKRSMFLSIGLIASYGIGACLLIQLAAPLIIKSVIPAYSPSLFVIQILALLLIFRAINYGLTSFIQAFGKFTWITSVALWNLCFIGTCLLIFIPYAGMMGAATALLLGEGVNTCIQIFLLRRLLKLQPVAVTI